MLADLSRGGSKRLVRLLKERPETGGDEAAAGGAGAPTVGRAEGPQEASVLGYEMWRFGDDLGRQF